MKFSNKCSFLCLPTSNSQFHKNLREAKSWFLESFQLLSHTKVNSSWKQKKKIFPSNKWTWKSMTLSIVKSIFYQKTAHVIDMKRMLTNRRPTWIRHSGSKETLSSWKSMKILKLSKSCTYSRRYRDVQLLPRLWRWSSTYISFPTKENIFLLSHNLGNGDLDQSLSIESKLQKFYYHKADFFGFLSWIIFNIPTHILVNWKYCE